MAMAKPEVQAVDARKKILLVEDELIIRDSLAALLGLHGYEVTSAETLGEARDLHPVAFDVLVIDIRLPDGSGLELIKEFGAVTPSIVMTAYSSENLAIEAFRDGAVDFLKKPFDQYYLLEKVALMVAKKGAIISEMLSLDNYFIAFYKQYHLVLTEERMAEVMGISRKTLFNKRQKLGLVDV
jgi:DNA-binding NtrC family response regulator